VDDSIHAKRPAEPDTAAADTAAPRRPPVPGARPRTRRPPAELVPGRPALSDQLVLRPAAPWRPGGRYVVEIRGVRNVTGVAGDVVGTLVVPDRAARDTLAAPGDSLKKARPKPAPAPTRSP
jgi:hypothetical protein